MESYFIVDDVVSESGHEGFVLLHGDPLTAVGYECGKFPTLLDALCEALRHTAKDERVYRVKLARRHGEFSCAVIHGFTHAPFMEHGLWQARGFNAAGEHFNRAFRSKRECQTFLNAMKNGKTVARY